MTKREICERLTSIRDELRDFRFAKNGVETLINSATNDIRDLILDLAAPEEDHFADPGKKVREEKEPPVLIYEENGEKVPCPVCGEPAEPIKNKPDKVYCKRCGLCPRRRGNR